MGQELGGPMTVEAQAKFMTNDLWTVHTTYHVEMLYPKGVQVILDNTYPTGIRFEGDEGWVFCTRGEDVAADADVTTAAGREALKPWRGERSRNPDCRWARCSHPLDAEPHASWQLAGKHCGQPAAHRADPAIGPEPEASCSSVESA